jgi:hypothetical protein
LSDVILTLLVVAPTIAFGMWWVTRPAKALPARSDPNLDLAVLLFRNNVLEHATALALQRFPVVVGAQEWADLVEILQPDYPDFPTEPPTHDKTLVVNGISGEAHILRHDYATSVTFHQSGSIASYDDLRELQVLRQVSSSIPYPVWKTNPAGSVVWQNANYSESVRSSVYE